MIVDLKGRRARLLGETNPVSTALWKALMANGAVLAAGDDADLGVVSLPLLPVAGISIDPLLDEMHRWADAMATRGGGRMLLLVSALAVMPMRRHPEFSRRIAGAIPAVRSLAMRHGETVAVNALALGAIGQPEVAGDAAMLSHVPVGRPGSVDDAVGSGLYLLDPCNSYTTGQVLVVDGGWSVGYGRSF